MHAWFLSELEPSVYLMSEREAISEATSSLISKDEDRCCLFFIHALMFCNKLFVSLTFPVCHTYCKRVNVAAQVDPCDSPQVQLLSRIWIMQIGCLDRVRNCDWPCDVLCKMIGTLWDMYTVRQRLSVHVCERELGGCVTVIQRSINTPSGNERIINLTYSGQSEKDR